jgi:hypothetical protein
MVGFRSVFKDCFYLVRREPNTPCPLGSSCPGDSSEDDYGSYVSGCVYCSGKGSYLKRTFIGVGFLGKNITDAAWAERAFQEGYSAGVTDAVA